MEDIQIIEYFWTRNQAAISEAGAKYGRMLSGIAFGVLENREDSEECVNDTYLKAWNNIPPQKPVCLSAYLGRIVRNISVNLWYKNCAQKRGGGKYLLLSELEDCIPAAESVENKLEEEYETEIVTFVINKWLGSLAQYERVLFLRRYWFCESLQALADESGTSANKLAGRLFRLRQKLKLVLEKEGLSI